MNASYPRRTLFPHSQESLLDQMHSTIQQLQYLCHHPSQLAENSTLLLKAYTQVSDDSMKLLSYLPTEKNTASENIHLFQKLTQQATSLLKAIPPSQEEQLHQVYAVCKSLTKISNMQYTLIQYAMNPITKNFQNGFSQGQGEIRRHLMSNKTQLAALYSTSELASSLSR